MNVTAQAHYRDKLFFPWCVESSPNGGRLKPYSTPTPLSDHTHSQLLLLKRKLLRCALEEIPEARLFKPLCVAANEAEELAWDTCCPLLVFPCLFEEMNRVVREQFHLGQAGQADKQPALSH
jgi:hypothetical protein